MQIGSKKTTKQKKQFNLIYPMLLKLKLEVDLVLIEANEGNDYDGNPRALYEYMRTINPNMKYVWVGVNCDETEIDGAELVERLSYDHLRMLATAKYIVTDSILPKFFKKRSEQILVQLNEGTPLAKLGVDKETNHNAKAILRIKKQINDSDYLVTQNAFASEKYVSAYNLDKRPLEVGNPRNFDLYKYSENEQVNMRNAYGFTDEDIVIIYIPTKRDVISHEQFDTNFLDLELLDSDPNIKLFIKLNNLKGANIDISKYKNVYDISKVTNMNELYVCSDLLLTDYSSVIFDYLLLDKPVVLYPYDLKEYMEVVGGFYIDYNMLPGEQVYETTRLIEICNNLKGYKAVWQEDLEAMKSDFRCDLEPQSSELIVKAMLGCKK